MYRHTALPFCITCMQGIPAIAIWSQRLRHTTPHHTTPHHTTPYHTTPHHTTPHHTTPHHTTPYHTIPYHTIPLPYHTTPHHNTTQHNTPHNTEHTTPHGTAPLYPAPCTRGGAPTWTDPPACIVLIVQWLHEELTPSDGSDRTCAHRARFKTVCSRPSPNAPGSSGISISVLGQWRFVGIYG